MGLARYAARRAVFALLLVYVAASAAIGVTFVAPSECHGGGTMDTTARAMCDERERLGLNRPFLTQYAEWMSDALRLDLGVSLFYSGRAVTGLIRERALNTALLAIAALLLATGIGIPLGIYTGSHEHRIAAAVVRSGSLLLLSLPPLVASLALVLLAAKTGWLPVGGLMSSDNFDVTFGERFLDVMRHVPLPALALALPFIATLERLQSQAMAEAAAAPFVRAARARGAGTRDALLRHAWPSSLRPVLGLYGFMIGTLFSGSFVVEIVTSWPGLGRLMIEGLRARDLHLVAGCAATGAVFLAIGTFVADLLLALVDPRVRLGAKAAP
jgi:peptide/nickel transport system permease protein